MPVLLRGPDYLAEEHGVCTLNADCRTGVDPFAREYSEVLPVDLGNGARN